jgi:hypothetical protein
VYVSWMLCLAQVRGLDVLACSAVGEAVCVEVCDFVDGVVVGLARANSGAGDGSSEERSGGEELHFGGLR